MTGTRFEPPISDDGAPFWDGTRQRRLLLPWCLGCDAPFWYPRVRCPRCGGGDLEWREASGRGRVHAVSVQHRAANPLMADRVPYAVVLVDLDEGVRMMSGIVESEPETVAVGAPVELRWEELSDGRHLPLFAPSH